MQNYRKLFVQHTCFWQLWQTLSVELTFLVLWIKCLLRSPTAPPAGAALLCAFLPKFRGCAASWVTLERRFHSCCEKMSYCLYQDKQSMPAIPVRGIDSSCPLCLLHPWNYRLCWILPFCLTLFCFSMWSLTDLLLTLKKKVKHLNFILKMFRFFKASVGWQKHYIHWFYSSVQDS